jgi:hypothetical protein
MVTTIKIKSRILFKVGDYEARVENGVITMTFVKPAVAASTYNVMKTRDKEASVKYDEKNVVIQILKGWKEKDLVNKIKDELDSAIEHKLVGQKLSYEIIK